MKLTAIQPLYVQHIPDHLDEGVLYISERFRICSHLCACGCKEEVVTPLSQAEWSLFRDGEEVSLLPSIGNWNYACGSHYFIQKNRICWMSGMDAQKIKRVQREDAVDLHRMLNQSNIKPQSNKSKLASGKTQNSSVSNEKGKPDGKSFIQKFVTMVKNFFS